MKIQYMSDLHLEMLDNSRFVRDLKIPVNGDILVLAGDTFYLKYANDIPCTQFWKWASEHFRKVLLVPGNHEYYHSCDIAERGFSWSLQVCKNVSMHQNQVVRIDDTDFIFSTLWSHINPYHEEEIAYGMNDFRQSLYNGEPWSTFEYNKLHKKCFEFIRKAVEESTAKHIVVVTHHLPSLQVVAGEHLGSSLNSAFATDLSDFISDSRIDVWIYGHSHANVDAVVGNTQLVSNQVGYVCACEPLLNGFEPGKFVEV